MAERLTPRKFDFDGDGAEELGPPKPATIRDIVDLCIWRKDMTVRQVAKELKAQGYHARGLSERNLYDFIHYDKSLGSDALDLLFRYLGIEVTIIGIGGGLATAPLPHHRTYGSVYGGSVR